MIAPNLGGSKLRLATVLTAAFACLAWAALAQQFTYEKWPIQQSEWLYFDPPVSVDGIWRDEFDEGDMTFASGVKITDAQDTYTFVCREWDEAGNRLKGIMRRWSDDFSQEADYAAAWYLLNERGSPYTLLQWAEACGRHDMTD
jgi:hypothetical protein